MVRGMGLVLAGLLGSWCLAAPEISRVMTTPDSDVLVVFGEGLAPAGGAGEIHVLSGVQEVVWFPDKDTELIERIRASGSRLPKIEPLPAQPPDDAKPCQIVQRSEQFLVAVNAGGRVLWVRDGEGISRPVAFGFARLWWLSQDVVAPGEDIRVFGKALISCPYRPVSYAFLVPKGGGEPIEVPVGQGRHPYYERAVRIPADCPEGDYQLFLHNGAGGPYGWSNPLPLRVEKPAPPPERLFNVRDFGAVGDGMVDDTEALLKALAAAEAAGGGIVYFPPGTYIAHTHLIPAENVYLKGAGRALTILTVSPRYGFQGTHPRTGPDSGLVVLPHRCGVSDMSFELRKPLAAAVFIRREPPYSVGEDVYVRRCDFRGGDIPWEPGKWRSNELPVIIDGPVRRLAITDCRFDGTPGGISGWGRVWKGDFSRNVFRSQPLWGTDMISIRHLEECIVEDNLVEFAHRGLCFQNWTGWGQFYHNYIAGNAVHEVAARRDNAAETYLLEGGSTHWRGFVASATADTVTCQGAAWKEGEHRGRIVMVTSGRGLGQYRFVADNTTDRLTLADPWDVVPDQTSYVAVGEFFVENLLIDNADLNGDAAVQYWGCCIGNVLAGHISRNCQGLWLWTYEDENTYGLAAFNEVTNCRFIDRGAIWLTAERRPAAAPGPLCFGNLFTANQIVDFRERPGNQYWPYWQQPNYTPDDWAAVVLSSNTPADAAHGTGVGPGESPPASTVGVAYNVFDGCQILRGPVAVRLSAGTAHNVFHRLRIDAVSRAFADAGEKNLVVGRAE